MSFAQWVKDTRERQDLSLVECASRAGVSHPTWIEYENTTKVKQPRRETVLKIAAALGVKEEEALEASGYSSKAPDVPAELVSLWNRVPQDHRQGVLSIFHALVDSYYPQPKVLYRPVGIVSGFKRKTR
jgi:transcriptional regulator with XRE-family HTH domain